MEVLNRITPQRFWTHRHHDRQNTAQAPAATTRRNTSSSTNHRSTSSSSSTNGRGNNSTRSSAALLVQLKREETRLRTFNDAWERKCPLVDPGPLAKAGFCYFNDGDKVQCVFCLGIISGFLPGDDALQIHMRVFVRCPFVLNHDVGNVPIEVPVEATASPSSLQDPKTPPLTDSRELGIVQLAQAAHDSMRVLSLRMRSFTDQRWPKEHIVAPRKLALAGFFFTGRKDIVVCYQCGTTAGDWKAKYDPWVVHAKRSPDCAHLAFMKGSEYGQSVIINANVPVMQRQPSIDSGVESVVDGSERYVPNGQQPRSPSPTAGGSNSSAPIAVPANQAALPAVPFIGESPEDVLDSLDSGFGDEDVDDSLSDLEDEQQSQPSASSSSESQNRKECVICLERAPSVVMLPCRHLCSCKKCAMQQARTCPVCRRDVKAMVSCFLI